MRGLDIPNTAYVGRFRGERGVHIDVTIGTTDGVAYREVKAQLERRLPLDGAGARVDSKDLRRWVVTPQELTPRMKRPAYGEMPATDLDALVAYRDRPG
jgi:hypothetical protein